MGGKKSRRSIYKIEQMRLMEEGVGRHAVMGCTSARRQRENSDEAMRDSKLEYSR